MVIIVISSFGIRSKSSEHKVSQPDTVKKVEMTGLMMEDRNPFD